MQFGFVVPWADAVEIGDLALTAERAGWDGIFVWEPVWGVDAWVSLAVAATRTTTISLGTMLTPLPRRKPWELAGQVATVDRLSKGRVVLGVGLGAPSSGYECFGEVVDRKVRAELLDEGLAILDGLWHGQPFRFRGRHYEVEPTEFPTIGHTYDHRRLPIWCVGALGSEVSMSRALGCQGLIPQMIDGDGPDRIARQCTLEELQGITASLPGDDFDVIIEGTNAEHSPAAWMEAGATWWLESLWSAVSDPDAVDAASTRLLAGPPSIG